MARDDSDQESFTLLSESNIGLKYTRISPLDTLAILYMLSHAKYRIRLSWSPKHLRSGWMNLSMYGEISKPSAMAVAANPMSPPFRQCRGCAGLAKRSTSWSVIWLIRMWSLWRLHSRTSL